MPIIEEIPLKILFARTPFDTFPILGTDNDGFREDMVQAGWDMEDHFSSSQLGYADCCGFWVWEGSRRESGDSEFGFDLEFPVRVIRPATSQDLALFGYGV